jgi:hypothetical protein
MIALRHLKVDFKAAKQESLPYMLFLVSSFDIIARERDSEIFFIFLEEEDGRAEDVVELAGLDAAAAAAAAVELAGLDAATAAELRLVVVETPSSSDESGWGISRSSSEMEKWSSSCISILF